MSSAASLDQSRLVTSCKGLTNPGRSYVTRDRPARLRQPAVPSCNVSFYCRFSGNPSGKSTEILGDGCWICCVVRLVVPHRTAPHHTAPHHTAPHHTAPHHTAPHHTAPHHTAPHHTAPHHTAPHHTAPHHTAPHRTSRTDAGRIATWQQR